MSAYISGAVWLSGPKQATRRFVLLAIADNANDEGLAWPSIRTIAAKCLMSFRTVIRCIADLEAEGWLKVDRKAIEGKGSSYQIILEKLRFEHPRTDDTVSRDVKSPKKSQVTLATDSGDSDDILIRKNHQEPSIDISLTVSPDKEKPPVEDQQDLLNRSFDTIWKMYPRKDGGKAKTREIYERVVRRTMNGLMRPQCVLICRRIDAQIDAWEAEQREPKYIPMLRTYLGQQRFDEPVTALIPEKPEERVWR